MPAPAQSTRACKARKIKCCETRPRCLNCQRFDDVCDYSIRLNWEARATKDVLLRPQSPPAVALLTRPEPTPDAIRHWHRRKRSLTAPDLPHDESHAPRKRPRPSVDDTSCQPGRALTSVAHPPTPQSASCTPTPYTLQGPLDPVLLQDDGALVVDTAARPATSAHHRRESLPTFGYDQGRPDIDLPKNDDANALTVYSPSTTLRKLHLPYTVTPPTEDLMPQFGFGFHGDDDTGFRIDNYYAEPVAVKIPRALSPLPPVLHANPMNMLYFHHFINYTARILVPHDCPENPFRTVLPRMALGDENLMHLLLAYAASHRSRLLQHPEPKTRIAMWVNNVFPSLRQAISSDGPISDSSLATAIMQASLEIVSPNAFEVPIAWQSYLQTARAMIVARGGYRALRSNDQVAYFLSRWFGYLDVCGSLSGTSYDAPLDEEYDVSEERDALDGELDCLIGVTVGCISKLAKVAALARQCDEERITSDGLLRTDWKPSAGTRELAQELRHKLLRSRPPVYTKCGHAHEEPLDLAEATAVNDAFHWTGLLQLECRVLGKSAHEAHVQEAVDGIVCALGSVRANSSAEACMVLPMFSAGCQAVTDAQRQSIMSRLRCVEHSGMSQVHKARTLMERVWATGRPWETLVQGEFVG